MRTLKTIAMVAIAAGLSTSAFAGPSFNTPANGLSASADAGAKIIAPLQIANTAALYFGTIAPSIHTGGNVVVSPSGVKSCDAELTCLTEDHTAAAFAVSGEADKSYTIALPGSIRINNGTGGEMFVYNFTGSKASGTLVQGQDDFTVGGLLEVSTNQPTGEYTGTFVVAVEYQ